MSEIAERIRKRLGDPSNRSSVDVIVDDELAEIRTVVETFADLRRIYNHHRNVELGDYLECSFCTAESSPGEVYRADVPHYDTCIVKKSVALLRQLEPKERR